MTYWSEAFLAKRIEVSDRARMCGTWATARWLAKQGFDIDEALWLLHPHLVVTLEEYYSKLEQAVRDDYATLRCEELVVGMGEVPLHCTEVTLGGNACNWASYANEANACNWSAR